MSSSSSDSETQNSDSSDDFMQKRRKRKPQKAKASKASADATEEIKCNGCGKKFRSQGSRYVHISKCQAYQTRQLELTCKWCDQVFTSGSALSEHTLKLHGDSKPSLREIKLNPDIVTCRICNKVFKTKTLLKYHIRGSHYNLKGKAPYAEEKKVNQVWFEKVMNSNNIIEIKKIKHNMLVMKKINENTAIKVNDDNVRIIDVTHMYPTGKMDLRTKCPFCKKMIISRRIRYHIDEVHNNVRRYHCSKCNKSYKRRYAFQQHACLAVNLNSKMDTDSTNVEEPLKSLET